MAVKAISNPALVGKGLALVPDPSHVKSGERYIVLTNRWEVYQMGVNRYPRLCGKFPNIHAAVFKCLNK
jgi:hypothetical protein